MSKYFFSVIALILLISGFTSAQFNNIEKSGGYARLQSMGGSPYLIDPYFITFNPAWASKYSNFIWGDIGSDNGNAADGTGQFLGANFDVTPDFTLGLLLTRNDFQGSNLGTQITSLDPYGTIGNYLNGTGVPALNNNMELIGSYSLANNLQLGLGLSYASSKAEDSPAGGGTTTTSSHQFGLSAGILASFNDIGLDAAVSLVLPGAKHTPSIGREQSISQTIFGVNGRVYIPINNKLQFVPVATFSSESGSVDNGTTSTDLATYTQFGLGAGLNYKVDNLLLTGGVGFMTAKVTQSATTSSPEVSPYSETIFPAWNLGAEWKFTSWLIGRLGYTQDQGSSTMQQPATNTSINEQVRTIYGPTGFTLGLGLQFSKFQLSATVNEKVLREGFNNIGGGTPTFAYLSASMAF
jgi:hypothetical protein